MSLNSDSYKRMVEDIEAFIANKNDAIAFLNEIIGTDIAQIHGPVDTYDAISRKELAYLIGLLLKKPSVSDNLFLLNRNYKKEIGVLREKLKALHFEIFEGVRANPSRNDFEYFSSEALVESIFYEEAGFYNDQPPALSVDLYRSSSNWVESNKGFRLESLPYFYFAVCAVLSTKYETYMNKKNGMENMFFTVDNVLEVAKTLEKVDLSHEEITKIIESFSCRPGSQYSCFCRPGDESILTYYPIIEVDDRMYWLPLPDMLSIALYQSPIYWMRKDGKYRDIANKNIGKDLETLCGNLLGRVFEKVYTSLYIYKGKNRYTDIDGLAILDNIAIIIQAKNKKMTPATLAGDLKALKRDFSIVAQEAYDQGEKSSIALLNQEKYEFRDISGKKVELPPIKQAIILCVSSGVYYSGAIQINEYLKQRYSNVELPIILSVFDLDLLTRYLTNPYEFIHYLELRIKNYKTIISNNEVAPLSTYLLLILCVFLDLIIYFLRAM